MTAFAAAGAVPLVLFPPERYSFYPRCPVYETFGVLCPGCGGTRALAALLRGRLALAMGWNALVTIAAMVAIPAAGLYAAAAPFFPEWRSRVRLGRWQQPLASAALLVGALFTLWRNLR